MPSLLSSPKSITLHRGINLITVCLLLSTPFLQSPQPDNYWLQGNKLFPDIHTLSGPIDLQQLPQDFTFDCRETGNPVNISDMKLTNTLSKPTNSKCRPLQQLGDPPPASPIMFAELLDIDENSTKHPQKSTSDPSDVSNVEHSYMTSVVIHCTKPTSLLPFNAVLGHIRLSTDQDQLEFQEAAKHTFSQLSDAWYIFAENSEHIANTTVKQVEPGAHQFSHMSVLPKWNVLVQISELKGAGLDSSVLSPFLETDTENPPNLFASIAPTPLDPYSKEALQLDSDQYHHVLPHILPGAKDLLRKYSTAFLLPGAQLGQFKGFEHIIDTGEASPLYHPPYRKSPAELRNIRNEIKRMLELKIIQPSHSEWGGGGGGTLHFG